MVSFPGFFVVGLFVVALFGWGFVHPPLDGFLVFPLSLYSDKILNMCFLGSQAERVMNFSPSFKSDTSESVSCDL